MKKAFSIVPSRFEDDRHGAIHEGIRSQGYTLITDERWAQRAGESRSGDVLLAWNLHGEREQLAAQFERAGGRVIVFEEAYTRGLWPVKHFAASLHGHNGSGRWLPEIMDERVFRYRWELTGLDFAPWREDGEHVLICGQRGIGTKAMASPRDWHDKVAAQLRPLVGDREIRVRLHPGKDKALRATLDDDLDGCWCCVVWSSGAGVRALLRGVPVIYQAPHWIVSGAASPHLDDVGLPPMPDRAPAFESMAWAQWTVEEIRSGEAFAHLLNDVKS